MESDFDISFRLQLQEAMAASLASQRSSSFPPEQPQINTHNDDGLKVTALQSQELEKRQEFKDHEQIENELCKLREDLRGRIHTQVHDLSNMVRDLSHLIRRLLHDQRVTGETLRIPEDDSIEGGDDFEKPFGEGCSSSKSAIVNTDSDEDAIFGLYFKGLVSEESIKDEKVVLAGIGIAICDPRNNLIFEVKKPLIGNGMSKNAAQAKALIEGLKAAIALDLKRVVFYCDYFPLHQYVIGRWSPKQRKVAMLVNQVTLLQGEFTYCKPKLAARHAVKYAFKLARDAITSQLTKPVESSFRKNESETCVICLEDTDVSHMFSVDGCQHRYCFSCMKQHVEVKMLHGAVPNCPHEKCTSELLIDSCRKFLTPNLIETMQQRIKEASIPVSEKIYCPYPRCSALMSKTEVSEYSKMMLGDSEQLPMKCIKCHGLFCLSCKVPWHSGMTCLTYKISNPNPPAEDLKLKSLAIRSLWRQCVKCNHMIELAEGCYHMTCRCGYEFCYNCGAEWKNKKATCSCPLWDEDHIWDDEEHEEDWSDEDEEEDENEDDDYEFDYNENY